MIYKIKLI